MDKPKRIKVDLSDLSMTGEERTILAPYFASTQANADGWIKMHCPIHGDANPSAGVNVYTSWWRCQACGEGGTIGQLIRRREEWKAPDHNRIIGEDPEWEPSTASRPLPVESLPQVKDLEALSAKLLTKFSQPLEYLSTERGIEPKTIERFKIGYRLRSQGGEYVLPMWHDGALVNVRYYSRTRDPKVLNHTGYGSIGLFPDNVIPSGAKLVIVEGEWDCYVTMQRLEKYGYTIRTFTNGTGGIRQLRPNNPAILRILASEPEAIFTIFDCDEAGRKASEHLSRLLTTTDVLLPYEVTADNGKDLSDYWQERRGRADEAERQLLDMMTNTSSGNGRSANGRSQALPDVSPRRPSKRQGTVVSTPIRPARRPRRVVPGSRDLPAEGIPARSCNSLHDAFSNPENEKGLISLANLEVLSLLDGHYVFPRTGQVVRCTRKPGSNIPQCSECPLMGDEPPRQWSLSVISDGRLLDDMIGRERDQCIDRIHKYLDPPMCRFAESEVDTYITYREAVVRERGGNEQALVLLMYENGMIIQQLGSYRMTGRMSSAGKTGQKTMMVVDAREPESVQLALPENYVSPPEVCDTEAFGRWFCEKTDALALKNSGIYNQTHLHSILTLFFTSPQSIALGEYDRTESGRHDIAIVGPTRTGKTTAVREIARAFGHDGPDLEDSMVAGESTTAVGLTAGHDKIGTKQYLNPGALPRNHGGYVFLDEQQELARKVPEAMNALNTARSSGIIAINKAITARFPAAVRFATMINPPAEMRDKLVEAVLLTYPTNEARARTDLVITVPNVSQEDQEQAEDDLRSANLTEMPAAQRHWLAQVARTISAEDIIFPRAGPYVKMLDEFCAEYAALYSTDWDHIGVMHPQTVRLTLQKYAASAAIFGMSFNDDFSKVMVKIHHLEFVKQLIDAINEASGYAGLMRERKVKYEQEQASIRQALRMLFDTKIPAGQKPAVDAFISNWHDREFALDSRNLKYGAYSAMSGMVDIFVQQGLMVHDKDGRSNNLVMIEEFRTAIGERRMQRRKG